MVVSSRSLYTPHKRALPPDYNLLPPSRLALHRALNRSCDRDSNWRSGSLLLFHCSRSALAASDCRHQKVKRAKEGARDRRPQPTPRPPLSTPTSPTTPATCANRPERMQGTNECLGWQHNTAHVLPVSSESPNRSTEPTCDQAARAASSRLCSRAFRRGPDTREGNYSRATSSARSWPLSR